MPLPARHERSAPCFDDTRPEEVERYFADLEDLFTTLAINDENQKKQAAVKYLKAVSTEKLWKSSPAFDDIARSYADFKTEILHLYPSSGLDRTYTLQDLDMLIGERARVGIISANDVADYYRQFLLISRYLISKNRMSTIDQSRSFLRGLSPELAHRVRQRLELRYPAHMPEDPYPITDVYDATNFIIGGSGGGTLAAAPLQTGQQAGQYQPAAYWAPPQQVYNAATSPQNPYARPAPPASADPTTIKIEALTAAVASLGEMLKMAIDTQQGGGNVTVGWP
jgi:hypothetical protein